MLRADVFKTLGGQPNSSLMVAFPNFLVNLPVIARQGELGNCFVYMTRLGWIRFKWATLSHTTEMTVIYHLVFDLTHLKHYFNK